MGTYWQGLLERETGRLAPAADALAEAAGALMARGAVRDAVSAAEMEAVVLRSMGRGEEALARLGELAARLPADAACDRARLALNTGWVQTLERARRGVDVDPRPALEAAHAAFAAGPCMSPGPRETAALNLALAALDAGDVPAARRWVATLPAEGTPSLRSWRLDIEGRLALASGDATGARALYTRLARLAHAGAPEVAWRAAVGLGEALEAGGDVDGAIAAWRSAETLLDAEALSVPLDRDRGRFVIDRARSARRLTRALVERGRAREALCVARLARVRALARLAGRARVAGLDGSVRSRWEAALGRWFTARSALEAAAADDWTLDEAALGAARAARVEQVEAGRRALVEALSVLEQRATAPVCDDLPKPSPETVTLAWFATGDGPAVWGFAETVGGVRAVKVEGRTPDALLAPFTAELAAHRRVRLIAADGIDAVDFARAPWPAGEARYLGAARALGWALDLPAPRADDAGRTAVVVADPGRDLPGARREAAAAGDALAAAGWQVTRLDGAAATGDAVRAALRGATLFHYAGHGEAAVGAPFAARLPLGGGGWLGIGDLLAMTAGPRVVVLAGCRTGLTDARSAAGGITLAHGFLLAGAESVLATTRAVDDARASVVGAAIARALAGQPGLDLAEATRQVMASSSDGGDGFRVWVR